jgi:RES domain-containing protein
LTAARICKAKYPENDGEGARLHGGRWNHKVTPMIYCGQTASLAALEVLANSAGLPSNMVNQKTGDGRFASGLESGRSERFDQVSETSCSTLDTLISG